jgi:hypothetical protein
MLKRSSALSRDLWLEQRRFRRDLQDSLVVFLHWSQSGNPFDAIAQSLGFVTPTVYETLHDLVQTIHDPFLDAFIPSSADSPD